jgi:hypothetical protein
MEYALPYAQVDCLGWILSAANSLKCPMPFSEVLLRRAVIGARNISYHLQYGVCEPR